MEYTILIADDETELLDVLELYLEKDDIRVLKAQNGKEAVALFHEYDVHLALLDIMMPEMDGYTVLKEIRQTKSIPVIMISARGADHDKILGLDLGADDYIAKPFNPMEVAARVKAQLRRGYALAPTLPQQAEETVRLFDLALNLAEHTLLKNGLDITLTATEYKILSLLMPNPGRVFTKKQIYEHVWQDYYVEDDSALLVHISNLRNKIETDPKHPVLLKTIKGLGYKMERDTRHEEQ